MPLPLSAILALDKASPNKNKLAGGVNAAANIANFAGTMMGTNEFGRPSTFASTLKTTAQGAQLGMQLGGPVGAGVGAAAGLVYGLVSGNKAKKAEDAMKGAALTQTETLQRQQGAVYAAANPEEIYGQKGVSYFRRGGKLSMFDPGAVTKLSSTASQINGPSHERGGVDMGFGQEAEGGETLAHTKDGTYVMTNLHGIADAHRIISRQLNKIENKPPTPERVNAMRALRIKEQRLVNLQKAFQS